MISIYVVALLITDFGDVPFDYWFNFYDLPVRLLHNPDADHYLGIVFSDGWIFPLMAIVFCYYCVKYLRPWLLSFLFAALLGIMEVGYVKAGYMVYHQWNHWITPALSFILLRFLAHFAARYVYYSPPISYRFRLICFTYVITEWPGAIMGSGLMGLFHWRFHIFENVSADDRFIAMILAAVMGVGGAVVSPMIRQKYKKYLFFGLGLVSALFALWMHQKGWLLYTRWNNVLTIIRYMTPYVLVYLYDRWEFAYTKAAEADPPGGQRA
jgi:hypothetical protein